MIRLAERRCTVSSLRVLDFVCGSQMMLAYSKMGRTLKIRQLDSGLIYIFLFSDISVYF